jgi:HEAT repeat protein
MIERMIEQLAHDDPAVRFEAAQKLGASKDTRAIEPLIGALPDENSKVQYAAFSGLVKLSDARAAASRYSA